MKTIYGIANVDASERNRADADRMRRAASGSTRVELSVAWREAGVGDFVAGIVETAPVASGEVEQPRIYADRELTLVGSIRIDNRDEIADALGVDRADAIADEALALAAYRKWGDAAPERVKGDFAFAIYDAARRRLFLARDRMGVRRLYYAERNGGIYFASDLRALLAGLGEAVAPNESYLSELIIGVILSPEETPFKGVRHLLPGRRAAFDERGLRVERYWDPTPKTVLRMDDREFADEARRLLERAIANRLREERKIVLSLSGGVDSTTVGAMTARALGENETLKCVSSVLPPNAPASATDEREYIQALLAAESNIRTDYRYPLERTPLERIDERVRELGQPTYFFSFLEDELCTSAARQGGRAFWSGFGGDSFLSFSGTYAAARLLLDGAWGTLRRRLAEAKHTGANLSFRRVLAQAIYSRSASLRRWRGVELLPRDIVDDAPVRADERETLWEKLQTAAPTPLRTDYFQEILIDEFSSGRAAAKMARVQERMGLFGLSFTAPTLDDMVVEFVLALPPDQFIAQGARRSLLRRATKGVLPERIRLRADKTPYLPDVAARKQETGAAAREYFLATEADDETWKLVDRRRALEAAEIAAGASGADFGERMRSAEYAFNVANILAFTKFAREFNKQNQSIIDSRM